MRASSSPPERPAIGPGLESLVAPVSRGRFLEEFWQRAVFHAPGAAHRLARIEAAIGNADLGSLLAASRDFAVVGGGIDPRARGLTHAQAARAYGEGATVYMRMAESFALCAWARELAHELGELPHAITSLFAVRGGHGTAAHLDWNENFTVQLRGAKVWRVAAPAAEFLAHPLANWSIGDTPPLHAGPATPPASLPADAAEYRLSPGAVLYVPRGFLHAVEAAEEGDSLSLNFSFPPSPWGVVLATLLATRLLEDPAFREGMRGAFGAGWGRAQALEHAEAMVAGLGARAQGLGADLRRILEDEERLRDYLARRALPRL